MQLIQFHADAALSVKWHQVAIFFTSIFTTDDLLRVLTTHPTYQRVLTEYLEPGKVVGHQLTNRKAVNGNNNLHEGSISPQYCKKYD